MIPGDGEARPAGCERRRRRLEQSPTGFHDDLLVFPRGTADRARRAVQGDGCVPELHRPEVGERDDTISLVRRGLGNPLGRGPVGLCGIAGAKLRGAGRIFAVGTRPKPVEIAKAYGATDIISYKNGSAPEQILELTDGVGVDACITSGGGPDINMDAMKCAKAGSYISNNNYFGKGMTENDWIPLNRVDWGVGMSSKQLVNGLCPGGKVRMERLADIIKYKRMDPALMATHVFRGFEKIEDALAMMKTKGPDVIKPVVICE